VTLYYKPITVKWEHRNGRLWVLIMYIDDELYGVFNISRQGDVYEVWSGDDHYLTECPSLEEARQEAISRAGLLTIPTDDPRGDS